MNDCTCNTQPTNCCPVHGDCNGNGAPDPVLPRCDNVLIPGTYQWATVVVDANGCIAEVQSGQAPVYQPDVCCAQPSNGGGGSGGSGSPGPPGPPGQNATVAVGQTFTVSPGESANVINVGTTQNAILDFYIPEGQPGSGGGGGGGGLTDSTAGIEFDNGLLQSLPPDWPPVLELLALPSTPLGIGITWDEPSPGTWTAAINATQFRSDLQAEIMNDVNTLVTNLQSQIDALTARVDTVENDCCP